MTDAGGRASAATLDAQEATHTTRLRRMSIAAGIACALAVATLATYLVRLARQGSPPHDGRVLVSAASIATFGSLTGVAALVRQARIRTVLLGLSTPGLIGVGFIAAWSIGLPLRLAGIRTGSARVPAARAAGIRPLLLVCGRHPAHRRRMGSAAGGTDPY